MLRGLLADANVPLDVDAQLLPVLAQFTADESVRQGHNLDSGPEIVTFVRNRLVHPEGSQERVYRYGELLTETWCMTRHYAILLILHALGYNGLYRDLRRLSESVVEPAPWK